MFLNSDFASMSREWLLSDVMWRFSEILSMCVPVSYHHYQKYLYTQSWLSHRVAGLLKDMFPHLLSKVEFSNKRALGFKSML